ncbi:MAG: uracil-DNA glycosylase [Thiolinea sp.]
MDRQTRSRYLKAMGIPLWIPKDLDTAIEPELAAEITPPTLESDWIEPVPPAVKATHSSMDLSELFPDQAKKPIVAAQTISTKPTVLNSKTPDCSQLNWDELQASVEACQLCELHKTRTQTVFGAGHQQARCMVIGEAPGAEEDRQGLPFVGKSGQLLTNMLASIQIARENIYIANILKCRPPNNRDPKPDEAACCRGYLERQIALIQPQLIMVVGRIAAHNLLQTTTPLGRLRGSVHTLPNSNVPVIVTYHPAYLLRQPAEKRRAWQDLQLARDFLASLATQT